MSVIDRKITKVSNSPLFELAILRAVKNCLIAHAKMYSGTSRAQMNSGRRCSASDITGFRFFGHGMFGWIATQVHEKMVTRQLHTMFQIVRQRARSLQRFVANERLSKDGMGLASVEVP